MGKPRNLETRMWNTSWVSTTSKAKVSSKNYEEAVKCFRKAAEQGDSRAQFYLSCCYANGWGVPVDRLKAEECYRKVIEQTGTLAGPPTILHRRTCPRLS